MQHLHEGVQAKQRAVPAGVVIARTRFEGVGEPARDELFMAGTEVTRPRPDMQGAIGTTMAASAFGIRSPREGSLYAIDPDMPPRAQRITFEGEAGTWVLDGQVVGRW